MEIHENNLCWPVSSWVCRVLIPVNRMTVFWYQVLLLYSPSGIFFAEGTPLGCPTHMAYRRPVMVARISTVLMLL